MFLCGVPPMTIYIKTFYICLCVHTHVYIHMCTHIYVCAHVPQHACGGQIWWSGSHFCYVGSRDELSKRSYCVSCLTSPISCLGKLCIQTFAPTVWSMSIYLIADFPFQVLFPWILRYASAESGQLSAAYKLNKVYFYTRSHRRVCTAVAKVLSKTFELSTSLFLFNVKYLNVFYIYVILYKLLAAVYERLVIIICMHRDMHKGRFKRQ